MPYVDETARVELESRWPRNPGELNYLLTILIDKFDFDDGLEDLLWHAIDRYLGEKDRESYTHYNEVIGVLRCAQLEHQRREWVGSWVLERLEARLYRERIAPYEDSKIRENGDVPRSEERR